MKHEKRTPTKILVKNSILNLSGMIIPIFVGLFAIPLTIKGLGNEGFGILSLAWVSIGYLVLLDFGLSRSTTKYIADSLHRGDAYETNSYFNISILLALIFGVFGGTVFYLLTPVLVHKLLNIPLAYQVQTIDSFRLIAFSLPFLLISIIAKGSLGAAQRFDLINYVHIPTSILYFIIPSFSYFFNLNIFQVVGGILISRIIAMAAYILLSMRVLQIQISIGRIAKERVVKIISFGGWVTVTGILSPLLVYIDRFFIGSALTMSALTYYSAPMEALTRLRIFPNSIMLTMFPEFSKKSVHYTNDHIRLLFGRAFKIIFIIAAGSGFFLFATASDILNLWLGPEYIEKSLFVFKVIALGIVFNFMALLPFTFLQGIGRPDIPAKLHLIELPIYLVGLIYLIHQFGLHGAAIAWSLRVVLDGVLLYWSVNKYVRDLFELLKENNLIRLLIIFLFYTVFLILISVLMSHLITRIVLFILTLIITSLFIWFMGFDENERTALRSAVRFSH